jgi:ferrous iron transport protein B
MSCTAKLPIYAFFVNAFFPKQGGLVMTGLYLLGIVLGIVVAHFYNRTIFKGDPTPLVLELPNYRIPSLKNTGQLMWEKAKDFLQKAFSVILIATVIVWFLSHFDLALNLLSNEQTDQSLLAIISGWLAPILAPTGLGDWRIGTSLISGFMAKESVVAVMEQLFAPMGGVPAVLTTLQAASMLVFALLYTPCVAAIAAIKRELGAGWAIRVAVGMFAMAWVTALAVRLIGMALGMA